MLNIAIKSALKAGEEILKIYNSDFQSETKIDGSPLTLADKNANDIIISYLKETEIPIISEENKSIPYELRKKWSKVWIVDPLDGTKEFINKNGEFTVNIALIKNKKPFIGVVFAPFIDILYFGQIGIGGFKLKDARSHINDLENILQLSKKLPLKNQKSYFTVISSRSHPSILTSDYIKNLNTNKKKVNYMIAGSSLKICMVAEGIANLYPRLAPTMEWDTAAGHAICLSSGFSIKNFRNNKELKYNKKNLLNPFFICN